MGLILGLIAIGMFLLVVEILLLPGVTVAGIGAFCACGFAVYLGFTRYGSMGGLITVIAVLLLSVAVVALCLRAKTWRKFALKDNIEGVSQEAPTEDKVKTGDRGTTISRLAPMGKVSINGNTYEAKSIDKYIDPNKEIEVTGVENFNVVVKQVEATE